ncbi:MAG: AgmX/PglI C-terminal domain-containing protein [Fibrobacterota bacterium]
MANLNQTGVFYVQYQTEGVPGVFPQEFRSKPFSNLEPRFIGLFGLLFLVAGTTLFLLSFIKPSKVVDEKQMLKLQERYASLVLNQELPKPEPVKPVAQQAAASGVAEAEAAEEAAVEERAGKESVVERTQRKEATSAVRASQREAMKKQISNVGLFAELTAAGGGGGGGGSGGRAVKDLIGGIGGGGSLSDLAISNASFVQRRESEFGGGGGGGGDGSGRARRGERAEAGSIGTSGLSSASAGTFKSEGSVDMSAVDKIEGEAANDASRDMRSLQGVLSKHQPRLKKVYEDFLKRNPALQGKLVVKFTIEADGSISNVIIVSSDLKDNELENEIIKRVQRIKFAPASGKVTIEWPMVFSPS